MIDPLDRAPCPCCGFLTLDADHLGENEICPVCFWEDDQDQREDPTHEGGANDVSLEEARANFQLLGASDPDLVGAVRKPTLDEIPREEQ